MKRLYRLETSLFTQEGEHKSLFVKSLNQIYVTSSEYFG